jgi:hypothetical protein
MSKTPQLSPQGGNPIIATLWWTISVWLDSIRLFIPASHRNLTIGDLGKNTLIYIKETAGSCCAAPICLVLLPPRYYLRTHLATQV